MGYYLTKESLNISSNTMIDTLKFDYFNLLPQDMQIEILSMNKEVLIISMRINKHFNRLLSKIFVVKIGNLPISKKEITNNLHIHPDIYSDDYLNSKIFLDNCLNSKIFLDSFMIYDYYVNPFSRLQITIKIYQREYCSEIIKINEKLTYEIIKYIGEDLDLHIICTNMDNIDLFSKYIIYKNRYCDRYQNNFAKNKILKELEDLKNKYLSLNNDLYGDLFNEYLLVQKNRFDKSYKNNQFKKSFCDIVRCRRQNGLKPSKFNETFYKELCENISNF